MNANYDAGETSIIILEDLDNDGDLDIISGSKTGKKIGWQENIDGAGHYGNLNLITSNVDHVTDLMIIDIDGDGYKDLISGSSEDGKIAWYKNDGFGYFSKQKIIIEYLTNVHSVFGGDIDGDGDTDIIASVGCCTITWFENTDGQGSFASQKDIVTIYNPVSVVLDDIDGDGNLDIITNSLYLDSYIRIMYLKNINGLGNFSVSQIIHTYIPEKNYSVRSQVQTGDIDNDGDKDIIFTANNQMGWLENVNGFSSFANNPHIVVENYIRNRFGRVKAVDIDTDGDLDIITIGSENQGLEKISWYENTNGQGDFSNQNIIKSLPHGGNFIDAGDIDNDGNLDVISNSNAPYDYVSWYKNDGSNFMFSDPKYTSKMYHNPTEATAIDLDNDGDLDVVNIVSNYFLVWYENLDGLGNLGYQKILASGVNGKLQFSDLNGDGNIDIVASHGNNLMWLKNNGLANFSKPIEIIANPNVATYAFLGDIDGDGDIDIVSTNHVNSNSNYIAYNENLDGLGNFGNSIAILNLGSNTLKELEIKDLDGDNDNDIAFVGDDGILGSGGQIGWLKNLDGNGNFGSKIILNNDEANSIYVSDIDGDGDEDIITGTDSPSLLAWYENTDGQGSFSSRKVIFSSNQYNGISDIKIADMDNDGDLDIVISSKDKNNIEWLENLDGLANNFAKKIIATGIDGTNTISPVDINGDGDIDLVFSASDNNWPVVGWFSNSGLLSNRINGQVILDVDNNGCDIAIDERIENILVKTTNGTETISTFTDSNGSYQIFPKQAGNYTTTVESNISYFNSTPDYVTSSFNGFGNIESANFCFTANQILNNLKIDIIPLNEARPGFNSNYVIRYQNIGTVSQNGTIVVDFDGSKLNFLGAYQSGITENTNQFSFNYNNLKPFEIRYVKPVFQVLPPPTVNIDDALNFTATINPIPGDIDESNNIAQLDQTVVGSYDPNDISVREGSKIPIEGVDEFLHYIIRFQNTGTASAINVQVENTLDHNLDWSTIEMEYLSHKNFIEITNGNKVKFIFENINLPDSTANEADSHGYIAYKIKPKSTSQVGDIFYNSADIYFDYNLPIYTNIVDTKVVNNLSIDPYLQEESYIYPNPTNGILNIVSNNTIKNIEIFNSLGQLVISKKNRSSVDISYLENGLYFIKFLDGLNNIYIKKVIKKN